MAISNRTATPPPLDHRQAMLVFGGLLLVLLLAALDSTIVATALPTIVGDLGGLEHLAWVVTAYLLAETIATPLYGKLGDLYGRKVLLQGGIVLFLIGSALCGLATGMTELILFRALQGLGGGGLTVTTQAVVGDIFTPRERGKYQGIFGAVFGLASIAGPLLGGYFTSDLSWRWIFYVNLPLGIAAMGVIGAALPRRAERTRHAVDYAGAGLLAVALSAIVLVTDLGGTTYGWGSPLVVSLLMTAALALGLFLVAERRAKEPVLPLGLFRNRTFAVTSAVGLIVGFALFGSVTYLPLFLQVVNGATPTASGLQMLPMMGGMLVTSTISGQLITRFGRYKRYPIIGTAVMAAGLYLLSRMSAGTGMVTASLYMLVLGLGLGMVMQVLVIAVQNAVDYSDLGVATSGATLFRLIGGALGTAALGAVFSARLAETLARTLPAGVAEGGLGAGMNPERLGKLPEALRTIYVHAFTTSLSTVFLVAALVSVLGFLLTWLVPEQPLRETIAAAAGSVGHEAGEAFPLPTDRDAAEEFLRGLAALADRDVQRAYIEQVVARAGLDLSPAEAYLLVRYDADPCTDLGFLARTRRLDRDRLEAALSALLEKGLVQQTDDGGKRPAHHPTDAGCDTLDRLAEARRERLAEVVGEWTPERREELSAVLHGLAHQLVPEARRPRG